MRAKQRKTVITELNLGNGNRPGREQLLVIIFYTAIAGMRNVMNTNTHHFQTSLSFRVIIHGKDLCI